jgi:hypothetical protein
MSGLDQIKPRLREIISWVLQFFGNTLKSHSPEAIKELYGLDVKLSLPDFVKPRTRGSEAVTKVLIDQNAEFTPELFTFMLTEDSHLLVSGTAVWKNARHGFTFAIEIDTSGSSPRALLVNQVFLKL